MEREESLIKVDGGGPATIIKRYLSWALQDVLMREQTGGDEVSFWRLGDGARKGELGSGPQ